MSETMVTSRPLETIIDAVSYREPGVNRFWAEEGVLSQFSFQLEGRDNSDVQDAPLTRDETKPVTTPQPLKVVSWKHAPQASIIKRVANVF